MPGLHPRNKPVPGVLEEFELDYRVDYRGEPTSSRSSADAHESISGRQADSSGSGFCPSRSATAGFKLRQDLAVSRYLSIFRID